ncbi:hypothetical protein LTR62_005374 [Meristemomyces frigidus]|uniref:Alpha/beta hydrolase fold-3 domain-containing protein n=1 Tax=Meristemomyces frigidus TaxID=1508187 RepID=A0AAN7TEE6_9PEZI|nr:hypothetical protein LTR62_005374 [Meristemomyces frigidus]
MPFTLDPEVGAVLGKLFENAPPQPPRGDVKTRRQNTEGFFTALGQLRPAIQGIEIQDFHAKSADGHEVLCRWFTKSGVRLSGSSAVCYAHGGGMISISIDVYAEIIKNYVVHTGVPFLVIEYRLAPEVQAPKLVEDCFAGLQLLHEKAGELGVDPKRIAVMGDSGGGALAAMLTHYVKAKGGPSICKQILVYPMLDDFSTEADPHIQPYLTWDTDANYTAWEAVLGKSKFQSKTNSPIDVPARMTVKDAEGLPPAHIDVGELDLFRDEDLAYARTLGQAGVGCEMHVYPGVPHAFEAFAPESGVGQQAFGNRFKALMSF